MYVEKLLFINLSKCDLYETLKGPHNICWNVINNKISRAYFYVFIHFNFRQCNSYIREQSIFFDYFNKNVIIDPPCNPCELKKLNV